MVAQDYYQKAILFATEKHNKLNQTIPGTDLPYVVHLSNVAMEIIFASQHSSDYDTVAAVQMALLHDTIEDTDTTYDEVVSSFGQRIAQGVLALSKNKDIPKSDRLGDSIQRVLLQPKEVWSVKLADRITNLQRPPSTWNAQKIESYYIEAQYILEKLTGGNKFLEERLSTKLIEYKAYIQ